MTFLFSGFRNMNLIPLFLSLQLPKWEESVEGCRDRYVKVVKALADKYPSENLLLVTHGTQVFLIPLYGSCVHSYSV